MCSIEAFPRRKDFFEVVLEKMSRWSQVLKEVEALSLKFSAHPGEFVLVLTARASGGGLCSARLGQYAHLGIIPPEAVLEASIRLLMPMRIPASVHTQWRHEGAGRRKCAGGPIEIHTHSFLDLGWIISPGGLLGFLQLRELEIFVGNSEVSEALRKAPGWRREVMSAARILKSKGGATALTAA